MTGIAIEGLKGDRKHEYSEDPDLRLELGFKNARLWHAIYDRWGSVAAFCRATKHIYSQGCVGSLISLKSNPIHERQGKPKKVALWLSSILKIPFGELFPPYLYEDRIPSLRIVELHGEDILALSDAENQGLLPASFSDHNYFNLRESVGKVLHTLAPREEYVIQERIINGLKLEDVAKQMNLSKARVQQIETKTLRKLRHPSRTKELRGFLEGSRV